MGVPKDILKDLKSDPVAGVKGLMRGQWDKSQELSKKITDSAAKNLHFSKIPGLVPVTRLGGRALPVVGSIFAAKNAWDDFHHGRPVSGFLNIVGMVPGPIGWLGMGGAWLANRLLGGGSGTGTSYGMWDEPNGVTTRMLPAAAAQDANVTNVDGALTSAQNEVFGFQDGPSGTVWNSNPPAALRLDTPEAQQALTTWLSGIADQFQQIETALVSSGEPYMQQARQRLAPYLSAMAEMPAQLTLMINTKLAAVSAAGGDWYQAVLDTNKSARTQLAQGGALTDNQTTHLVDTKQQSQQAITTANEALSGLLAGKTLTPLASTNNNTAGATSRGTADAAGAGQPVLPPPLPAPAASGPTPGAPATGTGDNANDVAKFLDALRNATPPAMPNLGGSPLGGGMPMGGMPMGGSPMGGTPLGGGQPLNTPPKGTSLAGDRKLGDAPPLASERKLNDLSGAPAENKTVPVAAKTDEGKPVAPAAAAAAGGGPGQPSVKPAASTASPTADHTVDVKGRKVAFPDAKTAALAQELAAGGVNSPVSLADAATKAGLVAPVPGQDPGQQVAPADAKPGDLLVAGDKSYLLLDQGKFLDHATGKVVDADQMPKDLGPKGGYFHLIDAAGAQGAGPVSGPTPETTTFAVDQQTKVPTDAAAPAAAAQPAASTPPIPPGQSGGVTSAGSPGVPAKGDGTGPANAAATDTGRSVAVAPSSAKPLDPTAIR